MTATLQSTRLVELEESGAKIFPTTKDKRELEDIAEKESHKRYELFMLDGDSVAYHQALEALNSGSNILWVVNTVSRCQQIAYQLFRDGYSDRLIVYHSRFRLKDREENHHQCVEAFRFDNDKHGFVAVTTQVCEMSLDLDADVLITELAPISALIQRFGRANRHYDRKDIEFKAKIFVYKPSSEKPYDKDELTAANEFICQAINEAAGGVSQMDLAVGMERFGLRERGLEESAPLFESGYFATPSEIREIDEYTVPAVLDADLSTVQALIQDGKSIDAFLVPVPEKFARMEKPKWLPKFLSVAQLELYSAAFGFGLNVER